MTIYLVAKGLVIELASSYAQSTWESRRERVRVVGLAAKGGKWAGWVINGLGV